MIECGWHQLLPGARLDILQNLVANTRSQSSAMCTFVRAFHCPPDGGGLHPAAEKTSACEKGSVCRLNQAGPFGTDALAERLVAPCHTSLLDHTNF